MGRHIAQHDTLRRCDLYADPYGVRQFPAAVSSKVSKETSNVDRLSRMQAEKKRREQDLLRRFLNSHLRFDEAKGQWILKVGRFVFLAAMVPLYLLLVKLPLFSFLHGIPFLFSRCQTGMNLFLKMSLTWMQYLLAPMRRGAKWLNQRWISLKEGVAKLTEQILAPFKAAHNQIQRLIQSTVQLYSRMTAPIQKAWESVTSSIKRVHQKWQTVTTTVKNAFHTLTSFPANAFQRIKAFFDPKHWTFSVRNPFKGFSLNLKNPFPKVMHWVNQLTHQLQERLSEMLQPVYKALLKPVEKMREGFDWAKEKITQAQEAVKNFTQTVTGTVIAWFQPLTKIPESFKRLRRTLKGKREGFFKRWKSRFNSLSQQIQKVTDTVRQSLDRTHRLIVRFFAWIGRLLTALCIVIKEKITSPLKILRLLFRLLAKSISKVFKLIPLFWLWFRVFSLYGIYLVRETSQKITSRLLPMRDS